MSKTQRRCLLYRSHQYEGKSRIVDRHYYTTKEKVLIHFSANSTRAYMISFTNKNTSKQRSIQMTLVAASHKEYEKRSTVMCMLTCLAYSRVGSTCLQIPIISKMTRYHIELQKTSYASIRYCEGGVMQITSL